MAKSRLSKKYRTTVPREVRDELGLGPGDVLLWEVISGAARVRPATRAFLMRRGSIKVGPGSTADDVRRARRERGSESRSHLVERTATGEGMLLTEAGHPVAAPSATRRPGAWKGLVWVAEDFEAPLPSEVLVGFGLDEKNDDGPKGDPR